MKNKKHIYYLIILIQIIAVSCSTVKNSTTQPLLVKNKINNLDYSKDNLDAYNYIIQRPNTIFFGIPLGIYLYNLGNKHADSVFQNQIYSINKKNTALTKFLSKKQAYKRVQKKYDFHNSLKKIGEEPTFYDPFKTELTVNNLKNLYFNNGYFNAKIDATFITINSKTTVTYNILKNDPFYIQNINYNLPNNNIDSILKKNTRKLSLKKDQIYSLNTLKEERTTISKLLRSQGYYRFNESLINFKDIDTLATDHKTTITVTINNLTTKKENTITETPLIRQKIDKIAVFTDYSYENRNNDYQQVKTYDSIQFYAFEKFKYNLKTIRKSIFIKPGDWYNEDHINLTRTHLKSLKNFKLIKINTQENRDESITVTIILTPLKKYNVSLNSELIHSNIKRIGISGGLNLTNRNVFKGAEILQLTIQGSIFDASTNISRDKDKTFNAWELGIDASLELPRFVFPYFNNFIPKSNTPKTKLTIGNSIQNNIGLDKQTFKGILQYDWKTNNKNNHTLELFKAEYVNNLNPDSYFNIYNSEFSKVSNITPLVDPNYNLNTNNVLSFIKQVPLSFATTNPTEYNTLKNIEKRHNIITTNNIIPSISYGYEYNSKNYITDKTYSYFRVKVTSAGNLFKKIIENTNIFDEVPLGKFVKTDIEFRKFWNIQNRNTLGIRTFIGIASPTGSDKTIPFTYSYFTGGSNDIRAWKTYELGPGASNSGLEFNIGNLKLLSSLEYRFKIINSFYGALFADAGNVWNLPFTAASTEKENFTSLNSLRDIALGTGFGLRYDFNFVVFRLDLGVKTYEPYLEQNKWFSNYTLSKSVLNIGINYPF